MTPPLYLTRADDWVGAPRAPITEQEWWAFAESCAGLGCETRTVTMADRAENELTLEVRQPVFLSGSDGSNPDNCLFWEHGYVVTTANEPSEAMVKMLLQIAPKLGANVQDSQFARLG